MTYIKSSALIETDWLEAHLAAPDVRVVDASYYLPGQEGDARADYEEAHIPGAQFFDIDDISDTENPLPHMLPSPEKFASRVRKLAACSRSASSCGPCIFCNWRYTGA